MRFFSDTGGPLPGLKTPRRTTRRFGLLRGLFGRRGLFSGLLSGIRCCFFFGFWAPITLPLGQPKKYTLVSQGLLNSLVLVSGANNFLYPRGFLWAPGFFKGISTMGPCLGLLEGRLRCYKPAILGTGGLGRSSISQPPPHESLCCQDPVRGSPLLFHSLDLAKGLQEEPLHGDVRFRMFGVKGESGAKRPVWIRMGPGYRPLPSMWYMHVGYTGIPDEGPAVVTYGLEHRKILS